MKPETQIELSKDCFSDRYAYITSAKSMVRIENSELVDQCTFNIENADLNENGCNLHQKVIRRGWINAYSYVRCHAGEERVYNDIWGKKVLNTYNPDSKPVLADEITAEGQNALSYIDEHFKTILGGRYEADIMHDYIAFIVQNPGKLAGMSPIIIGKNGIGKSIIGNVLMKTLVGRANFKGVSGDDLGPFNSCYTDSQVVCIDEMRAPDLNKFEVYQRCKMLITSPTIVSNEKFARKVEMENHTNYMFTTNENDPVPISPDDRRFVVFRCTKTDKDVGDAKYFEKFAELVEAHKSEILKWYLDRKITHVNGFTKAPMTKAKQALIGGNNENIPGFIEAEELLNEINENWNNETVLASSFFGNLKNMYPNIRFETRRQKLLMERLGYDISDRIKHKGKWIRYYSKRKFSNYEELMNFMGEERRKKHEEKYPA